MNAPELDALEKLADEATLPMPDRRRRSWFNRQRRFADAASPVTIKALIAELKEARRLMKPFARRADYWEQINGEGGSDRAETNHAIGDFKKARAFLARNGKVQ